MSTERDSRLHWIYASQSADQLRERYDVWAVDYDSDLDDMQWKAPQAAAGRCGFFAQPGAEILDAGCGTGRVGVSLSELGHARIVGLDLSTGMLAKSAARAVYAELHQGSLLDRLPFDDDRFASVVSVGVFTLGHVDGSAFAELARVTSPGGHVTITFLDDAFDRLGYRVEQQRLVDSGAWEVAEVTEPLALLHEDGNDIMLRVWTWRVLSKAGRPDTH
ncbi:MAG: class I SAM-dependent methyltransferase [Actinomycetota bacterium]|nr:class I SAM-dependent methyltransferase [Actinomycetota bacterium]